MLIVCKEAGFWFPYASCERERGARREAREG